MKKITLGFFAFVVFFALAGCSGETVSTTPAPSSVGAPVPAAPDSPVPETPPPAVPDGTPGWLQRLAPSAIPAPERYYASTTLGLIPNGDYGKIMPYVGQSGTPDDPYFSNNTGYLYGFVDSGGQIVCDPYYNAVTPITYGGKTAYILYKCVYEGPGDSVYNQTQTSYYAITNDAGDFLYECSDVYCWNADTYTTYINIDYEYIPVCDADGKWGAIDYDGNQVVSCRYAYAPIFSDGLAAVYNADGQTYSYIDGNGDVVLGPYEKPADEFMSHEGFQATNLETAVFFRGRALYFENGKYGFIDETGNKITPAIYDYMSSYDAGFQHGDAAIVAQITGHDSWNFITGLVDLNGDVVLPLDTQYVYAANNTPDGRSDGYFCVNHYKSDGNYTVDWSMTVDSAGKKIADYAGTYYGDGYFVCYTSDYNGQTVQKGDARYTLDDGVYVEDYMGNDSFYLVNYGGLTAVIKNLQTGQIFWQGDWAYTYSSSTDYNGLALITGTGANGSTVYGLVDSGGQTVLPTVYGYIKPFLDDYLVTQGIYGGLIDKSGNWIIKVSLLDSLSD